MNDNQNYEEYRAKENRKLIHAGLMVGGIAAATLGARGIFSSMGRIVKGKPNAWKGLANSALLTGGGVGVGMYGRDNINRHYDHKDTPKQY